MKKQNGITLIALVITIVVLLILAAVSINAVLGDNGILTKATTAKGQMNDAAKKEYIQNALNAVQTEVMVNSHPISWYVGDGEALFLKEAKNQTATAASILMAADETGAYDASGEIKDASDHTNPSEIGIQLTGTITLNGENLYWQLKDGVINVKANTDTSGNENQYKLVLKSAVNGKPVTTE